MDVDSVAAEVASVVGLAEGRGGVLDVIRAIARSEPVAARVVSRMTELPVPLVTAVCNELRKRGVVQPGRPARLTAAGRTALGAAGQHARLADPAGQQVTGQPEAALADRSDLSGLCPCCGGRGIVVPETVAALSAELAGLAAAAPGAKPELDQTHCTVATKIRRVLRMQEAGALDGKAVIILGDDDLVSVAIAAFCRLAGGPITIRRLTVVDADPDVLDFVGRSVADLGLDVELCHHDLREPLPSGLTGAFDVACTDPPYTIPGAELFLSRAVSALAPDAGGHVFLSFGARRPEQALRAQELMTQMGLTLRALAPGFNEYAGAGVLGGTSHLFHLRTTRGAAPVISGSYPGALYTADMRAAATRPYRCAGCKAVHPVGPGARWPRIADLKSAGCPNCGAAVFRPMALAKR
ncbi:MAG TPA: bis-aminopropyl spermidine synthase family protein [Streptosporangiaceae bacterium]|nr:bis-aminopropyl spermidine synthase family protein [Streptosporangiaceae bacterium]